MMILSDLTMSDPLFLSEKLDQLLMQSPLLPARVPPRDHALPDLVGSQVIYMLGQKPICRLF
jgi:hypothetical protein